jgi:DNA-binding response OmpR family regulator
MSDALRILVIDDDRDLLTMIGMMLGSEGYAFQQTVDPETGLDLVNSYRPHLILVDVLMPKIDGRDFCATLRKHPELDGLPILLMSTANDIRTVMDGLDAGADDYLVKPFATRDLIDKVKALTARRFEWPEE